MAPLDTRTNTSSSTETSNDNNNNNNIENLYHQLQYADGDIDEASYYFRNETITPLEDPQKITKIMRARRTQFLFMRKESLQKLFTSNRSIKSKQQQQQQQPTSNIVRDIYVDTNGIIPHQLDVWWRSENFDDDSLTYSTMESISDDDYYNNNDDDEYDNDYYFDYYHDNNGLYRQYQQYYEEDDDDEATTFSSRPHGSNENMVCFDNPILSTLNSWATFVAEQMK